MFFNHDLRQRAQLHEQWFQRQNEELLVNVFCCRPVPYGGLDLDVSPKDILERSLRNAECMAVFPTDCMISMRPNFAPAFTPAVAGAGFSYDEHTSWSIHEVDEIADIHINRFDPNHPLYAKFQERLEPLLDNWSWDTFLPATNDYTGSFDILCGFVGSEVLAIALYEEPELVKEKALEAAEFLKDMIAYECRLMHEAGLEDGMVNAFNMWMPGNNILFTEDFFALIGEEHYREFLLDVDELVLSSLDYSLFHTHSAGYKCLSGVTDIPHISAIEFGNDPNGPGLEQRIAVAQHIQQRNIPLSFGSWEIPQSTVDIETSIHSLDRRGLLIGIQSPSFEEAADLYFMAKELGVQRELGVDTV